MLRVMDSGFGAARRPGMTETGGRSTSNSENLAVARIDVLRVLLDAGRIVLHHLDVLERLAARLFLGVGVHRAKRADIDDELLAFGGEAEALEQPRGIRVRRGLEHAVRADR